MVGHLGRSWRIPSLRGPEKGGLCLAWLRPRLSLHLISSDNYVLAVRSHSLDPSATAALGRFTDHWHDSQEAAKLSSSRGERGAHRLALIGTTCSYAKDLHQTALHQTAPFLAEEMMADPDLLKLSAIVSEMLRCYFPLIYERFKAADRANEDPAHPLRCRFGVYPLFCLNYASSESVKCRLHTDWKNVAGGICTVMSYGCFNSRDKNWLVFSDLNLAIELPAGHVALYPSSLLGHGNVDVVEAPTGGDAVTGRRMGRGSLVWFTQANYIISRELGMSLKEAKAKGIATTYEELYEVLRA